MGSSSTTTQRNDPYKPAQPLINQGLQDAQALYENGGFNIDPYDGQLVASTDPFKESAYGAATGVAQGALVGAEAAQGGLMRALDPNMRSAAFGQVRQNVIDTITPQINSSFAGSGMTGSSLHAQNLAKGLSAGLAGVENDAFQQGEQRAIQAAGLMGQANQNLMAPIGFMTSLGDDRQEQAQAEIQAQVIQDQQAKTGELQAIQDYLNLSSAAGGQFGVSTSRTQQSPGIMGMLGLGLQAAPLFSDIRLKKDVEKVGKTTDGHDWYEFRYIWDADDAPKRSGVMAQEVQKTMPSAVIADAMGYLKVDYAQIGELA